MTKKTPVYVATVGLTLKDGSRVEPGQKYPGKPPTWLIREGKVKADG